MNVIEIKFGIIFIMRTENKKPFNTIENKNNMCDVIFGLIECSLPLMQTNNPSNLLPLVRVKLN